LRVLLAQYAPSPEKTARGVCSRIFTSSIGDHRREYCKSRRTISSNVVLLRPWTCQSPVIPGRDSSNRRRCQMSYVSISYGIGGRGPTRDIWPCKTFQNWGISSRLLRRMILPIQVTRGSLVILYVTFVMESLPDR